MDVRPPISRASALVRVALVAPLAGIALLSPEPGAAPPVRATAATGNVKLSTSRGTAAIVSASGMTPGTSVTGTVTVANSGDAGAALTLAKSQLTDVPGLGGGRLSQALFLAVDDLAVGRRVYEGPLALMSPFALAPIPARGRHSFRFTVRMPQTSGNTYEVSSTNVRFDWSAKALPPKVIPPPVPDTRAPALRLTGARRQRVRLRRVVVYAVCDENCTLVARARMTGVRGVRSAAIRPRLVTVAARRRTRIRVPLRIERRRWLRRVGRRARMTVTVTARDAAGNRTTRRRTIRLVS